MPTACLALLHSEYMKAHMQHGDPLTCVETLHRAHKSTLTLPNSGNTSIPTQPYSGPMLWNSLYTAVTLIAYWQIENNLLCGLNV